MDIHAIEPAGILRKGFDKLGIVYAESQISSFITYLDELKKWSRAYNLTGLKTDRDIVIRHFLDSALFLKAIPEGVQTLADIGSGAGFPGIPLKIIRPDLKIFLIEPSGKKVRFLGHICNSLGLNGVEIIDTRIEDIRDLKVDAAVTRALFTVGDFIKKAGKVLTKNGVLILNKGPKVREELKGLDEGNISVIDITLPFENITRHMVSVRFH